MTPVSACMTGRYIPQDYRIAHKIWSNQNKRNTALIFQIMCMLCFNKLTGEHNAKQEIVFKKDKATLHVISKRCEENDQKCTD